MVYVLLQVEEMSRTFFLPLSYPQLLSYFRQRPWSAIDIDQSEDVQSRLVHSAGIGDMG
jgi:hypothetical protein